MISFTESDLKNVRGIILLEYFTMHANLFHLELYGKYFTKSQIYFKIVIESM